MTDGFSNKPKILRGAFVEYGISTPPLIVTFQFNPVQLTRNRSISHSFPGERLNVSNTGTGQVINQSEAENSPRSLSEFHRMDVYKDLNQLQKDQIVTIDEESIGLEIRLDATDKLGSGDPIAGQFGISPQLSTLELMVQPKEDNLLGSALGSLLGKEDGFSFTKQSNPPMILFIWGLTRVLPVNIKSVNITETEFDARLNPVRASVAINLNVIEVPNQPYVKSKGLKVMMSGLNLSNLTNITDVNIPE